MKIIQVLLICLFIVGCSSAEKTADEYHKEGLQAWETKSDSETASKLFTKGLEVDPDHAEMRLNLARIYYEYGEKPYLNERRAITEAKIADEKSDNQTAAKQRLKAEQFHDQAAEAFGVANQHLDYLINEELGEEKFQAHVYYLRFRTAMFFEEGALAIECLRESIKLSKVTGLQKQKYVELLKKLESETPKPLRRKDETTIETLKRERS